MSGKRQYSRNQMRSLTQYRGLTDEEFDIKYAELVTGATLDAEFEKRINEKLNSFGDDYDLSDLKINDLLTLRELIQAIIFLEDLERVAHKERLGGLLDEKDEVSLTKITKLNTLNNMMTNLRKDISSLQEILSITRKSRKGDKETTVINELERLKKAASEFVETRMFYFFCPKCNMLLATAWFLYPEEPRNRMRLVCNRKLDDGNLCGNKLIVGSKETLEKRGVNIPEIVPESFR